MCGSYRATCQAEPRLRTAGGKVEPRCRETQGHRQGRTTKSTKQRIRSRWVNAGLERMRMSCASGNRAGWSDLMLTVTEAQ
ncbi:uncharacterized protein LAJ45_01426 [Morchella importuna]|uniref:uncharacterized protein n=1 Tax=Morchella importuna TaxID=1174673 RepID=UPI001E8CB5E5|nr:uncharacterized protein LAJ45_01426 [Morchella importuna]KAH8154894.1 hypothetical protein LAJ45_01426 [Morchella importuna]